MNFVNKGKAWAKEVQVVASVSREGIDGKLLEGPYSIVLGGRRRLVPPESRMPTRLFLNSPLGDREVIRVDARISYTNGLHEKVGQTWCEAFIPKILGGGSEGRWIHCADMPVLNTAATISKKASITGVGAFRPTPTATP